MIFLVQISSQGQAENVIEERDRCALSKNRIGDRYLEGCVELPGGEIVFFSRHLWAPSETLRIR